MHSSPVIVDVGVVRPILEPRDDGADVVAEEILVLNILRWQAYSKTLCFCLECGVIHWSFWRPCLWLLRWSRAGASRKLECALW